MNDIARQDWQVALVVLQIAQHGCTDVNAPHTEGLALTIRESIRALTGWPDDRIERALMEMQARGMANGPLAPKGTA